jgi:hypothetical protein
MADTCLNFSVRQLLDNRGAAAFFALRDFHENSQFIA